MYGVDVFALEELSANSHTHVGVGVGVGVTTRMLSARGEESNEAA